MTATLPPRFRIERLGSHDRKAFSCGSAPIDRWFIEMAGQQMRRDLATVHLLVEQQSSTIAGFFTLSNFTANANELPPLVGRRLPATIPLPAHLLGYMGVDQAYQGQGIGTTLVNAALKAAESQTAIAASIGVIVHALDIRLVDWYQSLGFLSFPEHPRHLILTMAAIRRLP